MIFILKKYKEAMSLLEQNITFFLEKDTFYTFEYMEDNNCLVYLDEMNEDSKCRIHLSNLSDDRIQIEFSIDGVKIDNKRFEVASFSEFINNFKNNIHI